MISPALSPQVCREFFEKSAGPLIKLTQNLRSEPDRLRQFLSEFESLIAEYSKGNALHQDFLMSRAIKRAN